MKEWTLTRGKYLSDEQLQALLIKADELALIAQAKNSRRLYQDALILWTALLGLRREELTRIQLSHIHLGRGENFVDVIGKGNKPRQVIFGKDYRKRLMDYLAFRAKTEELTPTTYLFMTQRSARMSVSAIWRRWKRYCPEFPLHASRHTAATLLFRATGNLRMVQKVLGHSKITTTQIYADCLPETIEAGMEQMEKMSRAIAHKGSVACQV